MHQENRLPKNGKEGAIFGAIICTLSVLLIGSINIILSAGGFNKDVAMSMLITLPIIWVIVMIIEPVAIVHPPTQVLQRTAVTLAVSLEHALKLKSTY